jgi:phosphopantothenoylcysteine synthetase/decarboxylase
MYTNSVVQQHLATLRQRRVDIIAPQYGRLASSLEGQGVGRLAEPEEIITHVLAHYNETKPLTSDARGH